MIEIRNLVKYYGDKVGVDDISFSVQDGEILGFLGPNGAGKSTTMNILTGFLSANSGQVSINGFDILENPGEAKRQIGYLPEHPPLYLDMTVTEYLRFVADLKDVPIEEQGQQLSDIMNKVRITDHATRLIKNLSKGYRQRVGLAQALVGNPSVLILDEPTVGLDPKQIIDIRNLIKELGKAHTVILSSHILPEVQAVCERVVIINKGRIAAVDTPGSLSARIGKVSQMQLIVEAPAKEIVPRLRSISGLQDAELIMEREGGICVVNVKSNPDVDIRKPLFFELAHNAWPIYELRSLEPTLEDIFLAVTSGNSPDKTGEAGGPS